MTEILSQAEIDALLNAISSHDSIIYQPINDISELSNYLQKRSEVIDKNSFAYRHVHSFQGPHIVLSKQLINDTYTRLAIKEPKAIITIGSMEIIPINICPACNNYHYEEEVQGIYETSNPSQEFIQKNKTLSAFELERKWRVFNRTICCQKCGTYFQPTVVFSETEIADPYLCKYQTIEALDSWFYQERKSKIELFSTKTKTVTFHKTATTFFWDIFINDPVNGMETCPKGLLTNIVRYTPMEHLEKMLAKEKNIPVFDSHNFESYYKSAQIFERL
ncbi:MAG: hypothetical protein AAF518_27530 [Spirochaetota bacterium]